MMLSSDGYIRDLHQTDHWKSLFATGGPLEGDRRNLVLGVGIDGINPFRQRHSQYCVWPVTVHILNLPAEMRYDRSLVCIIPGPTTAANPSIYLEPLVAELRVLYEDGIGVTDGPVLAMADLLFTDYAGQSKLFCMMGQNAMKGCHLCEIDGEYVSNFHKTVYCHNRGYLPDGHSLRYRDGYFSERASDVATPPERTHHSIVAAAERCELQVEDIETGVATPADLAEYQKLSGVKRSSTLLDVPGIVLGYGGSVPVDHMHLIRNVIIHIFQCLTGFKSKVGPNVLDEEASRGRFEDVPRNDPGPWQLSLEEIAVAGQRAGFVAVPLGFGWRKSAIFSTYSKVYRTSDWTL